MTFWFPRISPSKTGYAGLMHPLDEATTRVIEKSRVRRILPAVMWDLGL
jgi:hypothetical protein